jgi:hypothetical protein
VSSSLRVRREDVEEVGSQEERNHEVNNRRGRYVDDDDHGEDARDKDAGDTDMHPGEDIDALTVPMGSELNEGTAWSQELPFSPKRRKLRQIQRDMGEHQNHEGRALDALGTPARPIFHRPKVPASASKHPEPASSIPHFAAAEAPSMSATVSRPVFLRPPDETESTVPPLPDVFSPHRRGEKFVPGGLAATVQQWILQTGQDALTSRRLRQQHDEFAMIIKVKNVHSNDGPMILSGCKVGDEETDLLTLLSAHVLLSSSSRGSDVVLGSIIGIRAPMWEVVGPDGQTMTVGVDWRLLPP